ncbi:MAG: hybrid sensor histidine kinase/response regulator [Sphingomonadales bacterium RIFCSPHIGHO2_01_FULL_65_20]|jgi:signal transduction histidine kinase|uniref:histidine kinase n=1 Tax=Sphingomonas ursincola TaxID=56361 RepID=A0A7V8RES8_9SPHN|nr:hybrid sensor histidine kinase/response regulator [Sphingomonas ursincola]MBA1375147.1 hybrid sensor histidine kinase/response regulator [Sphingomonas ursincola]MCH2238088.1 hybrid sensor histidine kinase/response regulator [Blastomonas sp.]OHC93055.1 MAG: hybrid sensor histidine kinase/response regulator [Sphingomonadales bacterium RIFCSPHIGHO2_01_FULL_65_20]
MTGSFDPIKCLLVDDLPENLVALEALLKSDGLECHKASSGEEALELLLVHDYALALLDVQMPGMDGFELAELMRGSERSRHVPIIFVTAGSGDTARRFRGYEAGAVDFIQKPIEPDILRSKANVFFELYNQRRQIAKQRDSLAAMGLELQAADAQKNRFLAVLAHELRNPIMALVAGLRLLERREGTDAVPEIRSAMNRSLSHMTRLVEDLLDISRIEQGKISLRHEELLLQDVIGFAIETVQPIIDSAGHRLHLALPDDPVRLRGDHARVTQIVGNLISNAARYTPNGGDIRVSLRSEDRWAKIEIADNGIGIAPEQQGRIFDIFAQVAPDGRMNQEGLGIGLALVKQLVELHGGRILLTRSAPGEGSSFEVWLPLA